MYKHFIFLLIILITSCSNESINNTPMDQKNNLSQNAIAQKIADEKFKRDMDLAIERETQRRLYEKEKYNQEALRARAEIDKQTNLRNKEIEKQEKEAQLAETQKRYDNLKEQQRENDAQLKKHTEELNTLRRHDDEITRSTGELIKKIKRNSQ